MCGHQPAPSLFARWARAQRGELFRFRIQPRSASPGGQSPPAIDGSTPLPRMAAAE